MKSLNVLAGIVVAGGIAFGVAYTPAQAQPGSSTGGSKMQSHEGKKKDEKHAEAAAKVGEAAPAFTLTDLDGKTVKLSDFSDKVVVLEWFNPECPFVVKHHDEAKKNMTFNKLYDEYNSKGVVFLAINSSASGKQGNGKELNIKKKAEYKMQYPVLLDESGEVGRTYGAKTTPHCFVINKGTLVYKGAIDNNQNIDKAGDKNYVKNALDEVLAGKAVTEAETKSYGCSVKYN